MKQPIVYLLLSVFALTANLFTATYAADYKKEKAKQVKIVPCLSIADSTARDLCNKERDLRIVRRAVDILSIGPGGSTHGGASDCAAAAEDDCNGVLEDVDSLSYNDGICIWSCKAFAAPSSGGR